MPIHDWTRVEACIFHAFHQTWLVDIARALNRGLLPSDYYALAERKAEGADPDGLDSDVPEPTYYANKAKAVVIRHTSDHRVIAMLEIVSPGNKNNRNGLRSFVTKAIEMLRAGVHLLIVDLLPPGPRDLQGIHQLL